MALFDYACITCNKYFEVFFSVREKPKKKEKCPKCGSISNRIPGVAGYQMNSGPASVRPRGAGSKSRKK